MSIKTTLQKFLGIEKISKKAFQSSVIGSIGSGFPVYNNFDTLANVNEYATSEDLYSIVRRIARTAAMIPLKVYKVVDSEALKKYQSALQQKNYSTQSLIRSQFLKTKALQEVDGDNDLQFLIDNPNPVYSKTEFYEGCYTFRLLTGNTYEYAPLLELGVNAGRPNELWMLPSQFMSLQVSNSWPRMIEAYRLQISGLITLPVEEVIHTRYFNPLYTYVGNELIGMSPLRAGARVLTRQEAETGYSVNSFQNSGISGIVSNKTPGVEITHETLGKMKTDFYNEGAGLENARKLLFMLGDITYTNIGLSPVDMDVLESAKFTFKKLCNLYGVSDRLFNNDATGSEISTDVVFKDLYTNAALPEVYAKRDAYNSFLTPKFNDKNNTYFIDCDITGITELQDDMQDMATVMSLVPVMNPFIVAQAFNWDTTGVENKWFIKQGYQTIEEAIAGPIQLLPVDTENGN
jgi:HK97 family phage portal protein